MEIKARFNHYNFNVLNLERSIAFYEKALGFKEQSRIEAENGSFIIVYLTDGQTDFRLELTWLKGWEKPYELGDNEFHLCVTVPGDYAKVKQFHNDMGCVCFENAEMDLYFISDPDGYWIEVLSENR